MKTLENIALNLPRKDGLTACLMSIEINLEANLLGTKE